jgi:hypothetical protein
MANSNPLDVECEETCPFCGISRSKVSHFLRHFNECEARKKAEKAGDQSYMNKNSEGIYLRKKLRAKSNKELSIAAANAVSPKATNTKSQISTTEDWVIVHEDKEPIHENAIAREHTSLPPRKRQRSASSFQTDNFAATPTITSRQSIDSTSSTTESQQPTPLNHIDYEAVEQPVANAQDPNQLCTIQLETNQSNQELSMGLQLQQRDQQLVPYSAKQATVDESALAPRAGFGEVIRQLSLQVPNPRIQLQLSVQRKVADTAESIWLATKGDTHALKRLFREGLASPVEVSNSRELSLLGVGLT